MAPTFSQRLGAALAVFAALMALAACRGEPVFNSAPAEDEAAPSMAASTQAPPETLLSPEEGSDEAAGEGYAGTVLFITGSWFDGYEYTGVRRYMEEAGYRVLVASDTPEPLQSTGPLFEIERDMPLEDVMTADYDAIILLQNYTLTSRPNIYPEGSAIVDRIVREAVEQGKIVAASTESVMALAHAGVLDGVAVTSATMNCYGALASVYDIPCTGAIVERDGLIVTASGQEFFGVFAATILEALEERAQPSG